MWIISSAISQYSLSGDTKVIECECEDGRIGESNKEMSTIRRWIEW